MENNKSKPRAYKSIY